MTLHDDLTVQIRHPLVEAAVVTAMTPLERRDLHARLADQLIDPDSRAWHLALGSVGPCADHADEVERGAQRAQKRGDAARAATLAMHALRLTPAPDADSRLRRGLYEITLRAASGEPDRALRLADALADQLPPGPSRSHVLARRCFLDVREGEKLLTHELANVSGDPVSGAVLHGTLGLIHGLYRADLPVGLQHALRAVELARDHEDLELLSEVAVVAATLHERAGDDGEGLLREAERCWDAGHRSVLGRWPMIFRGRLSLWSGDLATAEACFAEAHRRSMTHGTCFQGPYRFHDRATVALARGDLGRALELAESGIEMARDACNEAALAWLLHPRGLALAHTGDAAAAIQDAERLAEWGRSSKEPLRLVAAHDIRGMAALARGHAERAVSELRAGADLVTSLGFRHPGATPVQLHVAEAACAAGDIELCHDATRTLLEAAGGPPRPWVSAAAAYAHGLSYLVAGGAAEAVPVLEDAAEQFMALGYGLDAARARFAVGRALTRAGRRTGAAAALEEARTAFASAQAIPWLALVDEELARVSPERATGELTRTESRIADLVARGLRNRDIAAQLFVCESTVEAHLTRVYRKLCVRSRADLTRVVMANAGATTLTYRRGSSGSR